MSGQINGQGYGQRIHGDAPVAHKLHTLMQGRMKSHQVKMAEVFMQSEF